MKARFLLSLFATCEWEQILNDGRRRLGNEEAVMDAERFKRSLSADAPPPGLSLAVQALWWDTKGDWARAHECAQEQDDAAGSWVHAYLHRKEGDLPNADYWYQRAWKTHPDVSLDEERGLILGALLSSPK